jgi:hypothetical protein
MNEPMQVFTRVRHLPVLLMLALLLPSACGDDTPVEPSGPPPVVLANGSMGALIDGVVWNADVSIVASYSNGMLSVTGEDALKRRIGFGLRATGPRAISVGSGDFVGFSLSISESDDTLPSIWSGQSGEIRLTRLTPTRASGTFTFIAIPFQGTPATGTRTVSSGTFDVTF